MSKITDIQIGDFIQDKWLRKGVVAKQTTGYGTERWHYHGIVIQDNADPEWYEIIEKTKDTNAPHWNKEIGW